MSREDLSRVVLDTMKEVTQSANPITAALDAMERVSKMEHRHLLTGDEARTVFKAIDEFANLALKLGDKADHADFQGNLAATMP
jgi:hypothetical protein